MNLESEYQFPPDGGIAVVTRNDDTHEITNVEVYGSLKDANNSKHKELSRLEGSIVNVLGLSGFCLLWGNALAREGLFIGNPESIGVGMVLIAAGLVGVKYGVVDKLDAVGFISRQTSEVYAMLVKERVQKLESGIGNVLDY